MRRRTRSLHRALVPVAALPLLLTTVTGLLFSLLEQQGIERPWLLQIHTGHFGRLDLSAAYPPLLGLCVLILLTSGVVLWLQGRHPRPKTG